MTGPATVFVQTLISTTTLVAQSPTTDNIVVFAAGAPWTVPGYGSGRSPLELYDYGGNVNLAFKPYGFVNLANDPSRNSHAYPAKFTLNTATGSLTTTEYGQTVTASAYTYNASDKSARQVTFPPDSYFSGATTFYSPLTCSMHFGQIVCSLPYGTKGASLNYLEVHGGNAISAGTLWIVGTSVANDFTRTNVYDASLRFT